MITGPHEEQRETVESPADADRRRSSGADALLRRGLESALVLVDAAEAAGILTLGHFEHAAARCAQAGIPIEAVQAVMRDGVHAELTIHPRYRARQPRVEPGMLSRFLDALTTVVSRGYAN